MKKIFNLSALILMLSLVACAPSEVDDLFDESPAERLDNAVKNYTVSWVEFATFFDDAPKSFTITCGPHTGRIPKNIRILGNTKYSTNTKEAGWKELYFGRINDKLAPKNGATLTLDLQKTGAYRCFRIECSGNPIDYSLAEFKFNY